MKRVLAVAVGVMIGVLLTGAMTPALMMILPPQLHGPQLLWGTMTVIVVAAVWIAWLLSSPRPD